MPITSYRIIFKMLNDISNEETIEAIKEAHSNKNLEPIMKLHKLNNWECHIKPDLLIIWFQIEDPKIKLIRIGSHSELFK